MNVVKETNLKEELKTIRSIKFKDVPEATGNKLVDMVESKRTIQS